MAFRVATSTLRALEWDQIVLMLADQCRTAEGRRRVLGEQTSSQIRHEEGLEASDEGEDDAQAAAASMGRHLFEATAAQVRLRLAETSEARALLDAETFPPLGGTASLGDALARAEKGGVLEASQLLVLRTTLEVIESLHRYLERHAERAPSLHDLGSTIEALPELCKRIDRSIDPAGDVRDAASSALANARRESNDLGQELQDRLGRYLRNAEIADALSDAYFTVRNDRYVLPVKADYKGRVRGIVHDASRSGATLFIEPEAVVDTNNRLKQAELTVQRETLRVLRALSDEVGANAASIQVSLEALAGVDLAFARAHLSQRMHATCPEAGEAGVFELPLLRHPLIPAEACVANDVRIGADWKVLVLSGPNAGGKTVAMKSVALAALMVRTGLHVPCEDGARVDLVPQLIAEIGDGQDIGESLSTFSAHMAHLARIVGTAEPGALLVLDEIGVGTDPGEGAALAQAILERLADVGANVIVTTHYNLLKEMAEVDPRFANASVEFDAETLLPTYRLHLGTPGASSAAAVAARMGMPSSVLERAQALLRREDRQLDRMLAELAASRATLESEQEQVARLRAESEASRDEYRVKLERLQERRDKLFAVMRDDLDVAFKEAHSEVARVIRELQRGNTAQDAAKARERLESLRDEAERKALETGARAPEEPPPGLVPIDWRRVSLGDSVMLEGGKRATLESLPDRRGRGSVVMGSAKLVLPSERVGQAVRKKAERYEAPHGKVKLERTSGEAPELRGGTVRCDLRGARVEEALDRLAELIDRATVEGRDALHIIHGHGTGALRKAVREHLRASPLIAKVRKGEDDDGGEGVTLADVR